MSDSTTSPRQFQVFDLCLEFETTDERPDLEVVEDAIRSASEAMSQMWPQGHLSYVGRGPVEDSAFVDGGDDA